ncbi:hypothetical protein [Methylobacterium oryzisoli]|uniref:hypothetical protein n=1 Tax=Methylobacterium oryzisoli TaxID=3385502 RepID=UPI00389247AF
MTDLRVDVSKREFLRLNRPAIVTMLDEVNTRLTAAYGAARTPVRLLDVWVITYCEAGMTPAGKVDPSFKHSEGEIGLYPLPSNITSWNGPDAPRHDVQSAVEINAFHYYLYLGHLKNKVVKQQDGMDLYRDLFGDHGGGASPITDANLLAGVVHGYFFGGNYDDGRVPLKSLLAGFQAGLPLEKILEKTGYKHAGSAILSNRRKNIEAALHDHDEDEGGGG